MIREIPAEDKAKDWPIPWCDKCGGFAKRYYNQFHRDYVAKSPKSRKVFEDMDLVVRDIDTDIFLLAELKYGESSPRVHMKNAQRMTFKDIDEVIMDPSKRHRYKGFYYIWSSKDSFEQSDEIYINGKLINLEQLVGFYHLDQKILDMIPPHNFAYPSANPKLDAFWRP